MKKILYIILFLATNMVVYAQSGSADLLYSKAEQFYNLGRFDSCTIYSQRVLHQGSGMVKASAYRLISLSLLEQGDIAGAQKTVDMLLAYDPYFSPSFNDPQRFIDMVDERKKIEAGITTASRQAESLDEVPVPVTVITEDMIHHSGARTLQEVLCLYVPGMSLAVGTEANIAMHGIAGLAQENILFLQDGHRLNGQSTNAEDVGPRNSLDKIQQIEVLRGPASSLYGSVALTAVVNIITRKGAAMNGGRISGLAGTNNTWGTSFTIGGGNNVVDILGWGSVYATDGSKHKIGNTTLYSGAFNRRPSYDIGIKARWQDFSIIFNSQRSKATPYINVMQISQSETLANFTYELDEPKFDCTENFNYDNYKNVKSNGPGITRTNHHLNLDYNHSFSKIDFKASGYISLEQTSYYNVLGDSVDKSIGRVMLLQIFRDGGEKEDQAYAYFSIPGMIRQKNVFQLIDWENISFGGQIQLSTKYNFLGHGNMVLGAQYEHFALTDASISLGGEKPYYDESYKKVAILSGEVSGMTTIEDVFEDGMENMYSAYAQIKHYFSDRFIFNGGLRYDFKVRFNKNKLHKLSPRASVIYRFNKGFSARASFNYSFVDAPYIYRACSVKFFSGGPDLNPESMQSYQIGAMYHRVGGKFTAEINGFYNIVTDFITKKESKYDYLFINAGAVKQIGVDCSAQYNSKYLFVNANATWQRFLSASDLLIKNHSSLGTPKMMGNVVVAGAPYIGNGTGFFGAGKLWIRATVNAQGVTWYQVGDNVAAEITTIYYGDEYATLYHKFEKVKPQVVIGFGVGYEWKHLNIDVTLKNITNNQYKIGSMLSDGVPHVGREFLAKLTFKF